MARPTSPHTARCHPGNTQVAGDGRLFSPVFERNGPPIIAALVPWLGACDGTVLEIGSGTGQHAGACALAFPRLRWQPSDPDAGHRASIRAWAAHLRLAAPEPLALDAAADWAPDVAAALGPLGAVVSMNVIHIAPPAVARGIVAGAGRALAPDGVLIFYGPFTEAGAHTGPGNAAFDKGLRAENPDWGLRDVAWLQDLGAAAGLEPAALVEMPADNRLLVLRRAGG